MSFHKKVIQKRNVLTNCHRSSIDKKELMSQNCFFSENDYIFHFFVFSFFCVNSWIRFRWSIHDRSILLQTTKNIGRYAFGENSFMASSFLGFFSLSANIFWSITDTCCLLRSADICSG